MTIVCNHSSSKINLLRESMMIDTALFRQECKRKSIHFSSLWIPLAVVTLSRQDSLVLLCIVTLAVVTVDIGRHYIASLGRLFDTLFSGILRPHEHDKKKLTGASYVLIGALGTVWLCDEAVAAATLLVLVVSDTAAALVGRAYGRHKIMDKSMEGSAAFFLSAMAMAILTGLYYSEPPAFYMVAIVASALATLAELYAKRLRLDDNVLICVSFGSIMQGLS